MEVIKVIVRGELPKGCIWCDYHKGDFYSCQPNHWCGINLGRLRRITDANTRPDWCPLASTSDLPGAEDGDGWIIDDPDSGWKEV